MTDTDHEDGSTVRFDRFTTRALHIFKLAQEESARLGHNYVGTEHLLLGILRDQEGSATKVLTDLGVNLDKVRRAVEVIVGRGEEVVADARGLAPRAKHAVALAVEEAKASGFGSILTEHLLLGLLSESEGVAAGILRSFGVDLTTVRPRIEAMLAADGLPKTGRRAGRADAKNNVVMCRIDDSDLDAIDTLIEAGVRANRSDAAGWLIKAGLESKSAVLNSVRDKVGEIRELRASARKLAGIADLDEGEAPVHVD